MSYVYDDEMFNAFLQPMDMHGNVLASPHGYQPNPQGPSSAQGASHMGQNGYLHQYRYQRQPTPMLQPMPPTPPYADVQVQMSKLQMQPSKQTGMTSLPPAPTPVNTPRPHAAGLSSKVTPAKRTTKAAMATERTQGKRATRRDTKKEESTCMMSSEPDDSDTDFVMEEAESSSCHTTARQTRAKAKASGRPGTKLASLGNRKCRNAGTSRRSIKPSASPASSSTCMASSDSGNIRKTRKTGPKDPDNIKIYHLRIDDFLSFEAIGNIMRDQYDSLNMTRKSDFSIAAVYGRFVRNAPRIAEGLGKSFTRAEYLYFFEDPEKNKLKQRNGRVATAKLAALGTDMVACDVLSAQELEEAIQDFTPEDDDQLKIIFEDVSAELWTKIADQMEDATGKLFEAQVVAERFAMLGVRQQHNDEDEQP